MSDSWLWSGLPTNRFSDSQGTEAETCKRTAVRDEKYTAAANLVDSIDQDSGRRMIREVVYDD